MENLRRTYLKNLIFTGTTFFIGLALPLIRESIIAGLILAALIGIMYWYIYILLRDLINHVSKKDTSVFELRFLFITLAVSFAGIYFFISVIDVGEQWISGIRDFQRDVSSVEFTIEAFVPYSKELFSTYLNSLYYSVVVMTTLGDSNIGVEGSITRLIVAAEVAMTLSITVFKIGDFYSQRSSQEVKDMGEKIISEVSKSVPSQKLKTKGGFFRCFFEGLTSKFK